MSDSTLRRMAPLLFLLLAGGYLLAEWLAAGRLGPPLDDGWIYMAFARSLVDGEGITYPGHDGPIASVTGPVWCALLAAMFALLGPGVLASKLLGVIAALFALWSVARLGAVAARDARAGAVTALLVAVSARFLWGSLSGMEVPFFVGTVSLGLALHLEARDGKRRAWWPAAVVLSLSGWARPECFVFPVLAALHRRRLGALALVGALLALYPLYHVLVYGHPLPTTFYAKAAADSPLAILRHAGLGAALAALLRSVGLELLSFASWLPTWLPLIVPGFLVGLRRGFREKNGIPFVAFALLVFVVARGALGFAAPWFQNGRYFTHAWPLFALVCVHGLDLQRTARGPALVTLLAVALWLLLGLDSALVVLWDWLDPHYSLGLDAAVIALWGPALFALLLALHGWIRSRGSGLAARPPVWACALYLLPALALGATVHGRGVRDTYELNVAMAQIVREVVPPGERVACHDIGALGWFADRPLLDLAGLGSPEVCFRPRAPGAPIDGPGVLAELRPRWLCLTRAQADKINAAGRLPEGLKAVRVLRTIEFPPNVTVLGSTYDLSELVW